VTYVYAYMLLVQHARLHSLIVDKHAGRWGRSRSITTPRMPLLLLFAQAVHVAVNFGRLLRPWPMARALSEGHAEEAGSQACRELYEGVPPTPHVHGLNPANQVGVGRRVGSPCEHAHPLCTRGERGGTTRPRVPHGRFRCKVDSLLLLFRPASLRACMRAHLMHSALDIVWSRCAHAVSLEVSAQLGAGGPSVVTVTVTVRTCIPLACLKLACGCYKGLANRCAWHGLRALK
jgi:hypothetical protein